MKNSLLVLFFLCIALFLSSCSKYESSLITTGPEINTSENAALSKPTSFTRPDSSDTLIVLSNSNKSIYVKKNLPKDKIELLDKYLANHPNIPTQTNIVTPNALPCGMYVERYWVPQDQYRPVPGKFIGIWPYNRSAPDLIQYRTKWGYTGIFCGDGNEYNLATSTNVGYQKDSVMLSIAYDWPNPQPMIDKITNYDAKYYYIDEAVNHSCFGGNTRMYEMYEIVNVAYQVHHIRPGHFFVSSGYKICAHMNYLNQYVDRLMYSSYTDRYPILGLCTTNMWTPTTENTYWIEGSNDQRISWTRFLQNYSNHFRMTWINTEETTEFNVLFEMASILGMESVWIYGLGGNYSDQFGNISSAAHSQGWLSRLSKHLVVEWQCNQQPCALYCNWPNGYWHIRNSYYEYDDWF